MRDRRAVVLCLQHRRAASGLYLCAAPMLCVSTFWFGSQHTNAGLTPKAHVCDLRLASLADHRLSLSLLLHSYSQVASGGVRDPFIHPSLKTEKRSIKKSMALDSVRAACLTWPPAHAHTYIHTYIHIYIHIHTYIHTRTRT